MARTKADNARAGLTNFTPPAGRLKQVSATGRAVVGYGTEFIEEWERNPRGAQSQTASVVPGQPEVAGLANMPGDPAGNQIGRGTAVIRPTKNMG